jgi:uncharacterized membrane protein YccC
MPSLFALCLVVLADQRTALFAGFGAFAMLAFADFGGPPLRRGRAYVCLTAVGGVLLTVGTLLSGSAWAAALGMAVVAFAITFAGSLGGYFAAGGIAAILSFVLAVAVPADAGEIPARLAGWGLAGAACTIGALLLWPRRGRSVIRERCADTAAAIADLLETWISPQAGPEVAERRRLAATNASAALARAFTSTPFRPAGPTVHDQALAYLGASVRRGQEFAERIADAGPVRTEADGEHAAASAVAFRQLAGFLRGSGDSIDLPALEEVRLRYASVVEARVVRADSAADVTSAVRQAFDLRVLSFAALSAGANAILSTGGRLPDLGDDVPPIVPTEGVGSTTRRLGAILRSNFSPDSVWFQAGTRAAVGLAIAVLVAILAQLQHAFWVVLGTLTVLKSNAVTTSFTAWQALLGTLTGFGLATAFLAAGGGATPALWVALPVCVFLAVYTPTAVHAVVGQAMFTLTVVVLFNLIQPQGWRTGLIRVEDILIGAATSLAVGSALWPRGASGRLRETLGALFEAGGAYVGKAVENALGRAGDDDVLSARSLMRERIVRATEAFSTFLNERGPKTPPVDTWTQIVGAGHYLRFVGDGVLARTRGLGPVAGPPSPTELLDNAATDVEHRVSAAGLALSAGGADADGDGWPAAGEPALGRILEEADSIEPRTAVGLVWTAEWIEDVRGVLDRLEEPIEEVRSVAARPWWR